jgi:dipeptidyl aminopeptidase/acylaminoacyl peptidase
MCKNARRPRAFLHANPSIDAPSPHNTNMKTPSLLIYTALTCAVAFTAWSKPAQAAPPVEAFFQEPMFSAAKLSPDGKRVAFRIRAADTRARLAVLDIQTMRSDVVASFKDADIGRFRWVNENRVVFDLEVELTGPNVTDRGSGLFAVNADGSAFRQLVVTTSNAIQLSARETENLLPWHTYLWGSTQKKEGPVVYVMAIEDFSDNKIDHLKLRRLNTETSRIEEVEAPLHSYDWLFDKDDVLRAVVTRENLVETLMYRDNAGATWRKLHAADVYKGDAMTPKALTPDGRLLVEISNNSDKRALWSFDVATNKLADKPLAASKDFDLSTTVVANRDKLLGLRYTIDAEVTQWLDPGMQSLQASVDALLAATSNRISVPHRGDGEFVLVEAFADVQPVVTYLYNKQTKKLLKLGAEQPAIDPKKMGQMDMVRYKARDGLEIPAYLTLPRGAPKKNLPLVVYVHGGPYVRGATWEWQREVQFLASRGYAVLQPEYRGSTGFGSKHFEAGWKQWGLAMQNDIADGAKWAIAEGIADAKRICIAGASYGGYATLMGLINDPSLYRCGFQWVGVSDINLMYSAYWSDFSAEFKRHGMPKLIGDREKDAAQLKATSPIEQAARLKQPLLMAHGGFDVRVPIEHGTRMRDALRKAGNNVEWIEYRDEGHGWRKRATNIDFWGRVEKFLGDHLAPKP